MASLLMIALVVGQPFEAAPQPAATRAAVTVTVTPWCDNSLRVTVAPVTLAPAVLASRARLNATLKAHGLTELPSALVRQHCGSSITTSQVLAPGATTTHGNLQAAVAADGHITFSAIDSDATLFSAWPAFGPPSQDGYHSATLSLKAGDPTERIFGLGQGNWTREGG